MYVCMYIQIYMYIYIYTFLYICIYLCVYIYIYMYIYVDGLGAGQEMAPASCWSSFPAEAVWAPGHRISPPHLRMRTKDLRTLGGLGVGGWGCGGGWGGLGRFGGLGEVGEVVEGAGEP